MIATYRSQYALRGVPPSFRHWQNQCFQSRIPPVIAVAGTRGKSTVVRLLQAMYDVAHVQTAIWTDFGVEINGRRQRGEIAGWNRAMARLTEASLDIAIQELDWNLVSAVGLPEATYPIGVITNLCSNDETCMRTLEGQVGARALPRVARAIHPSGVLALNGDDYALNRAAQATSSRYSMVARSSLSPSLQQNDGMQTPNIWIDEQNRIVCGMNNDHVVICDVADIPLALDGTASFQISNILLATAGGLATGLGIDLVASTLKTFDPAMEKLPGSFTVATKGSVKIVVDRTAPSWFLRPILRAANPRSERRQITVIADLESIPLDDAYEVGRLLGRTHGAIICSSDSGDGVLTRFKRGISSNELPPVFVHLPTERRAINRAMQAVRADDVLLFLTGEDSGPATRAVARMRNI